jgi:hypothetical protein
MIFELPSFITHYWLVMIVTIHRTFVLLNPLFCPVGAGFIPAQIGS